jgi:hypothetical protein
MSNFYASNYTNLYSDMAQLQLAVDVRHRVTMPSDDVRHRVTMPPHDVRHRVTIPMPLVTVDIQKRAMIPSDDIHLGVMMLMVQFVWTPVTRPGDRGEW